MRSAAVVSYNMSRIKRSGTLIERTLGPALWASGVRYRKQYHGAPGCPDFVVAWARLAIFCDSSFWHGRGWPQAAKKIKRNKRFWRRKIEGTICRDADVNRQLDEAGWRVLRFWDDDILRRTDECVARVCTELAAIKGCAAHD